MLDEQPVRVCGIAEIFSLPALATGEPARELLDSLLEQAGRDGAAMALRFASLMALRRADGIVHREHEAINVRQLARQGLGPWRSQTVHSRDQSCSTTPGKQWFDTRPAVILTNRQVGTFQAGGADVLTYADAAPSNSQTRCSNNRSWYARPSAVSWPTVVDTPHSDNAPTLPDTTVPTT